MHNLFVGGGLSDVSLISRLCVVQTRLNRTFALSSVSEKINEENIGAPTLLITPSNCEMCIDC
jgi:hypothetical protein